MTTNAVPVREIGLILLVFIALFVLLAIMSYSPQDPGFTYSGPDRGVSNLVGSSGAHFADVVLYVMGVVSYLVPAALVWHAVRMVRTRAGSFSWALIGIRILGWTGVVLGACVLIQMHFLTDSSLPAGAGGVLGAWLSETGIPVFGRVGLTILCLAGVLIGAQAAAGFSWLDVAERIGAWVHTTFRWCVDAWDRRRDEWRRQRAEQAVARAHVEERRVALDVATSKPRHAPAITRPPPQPRPKAKQQRLFDLKTSGELPDLDLLDDAADDEGLGYSAESLEAMSRLLEIKLADFGVQAEVESVLPGPVITRFELQPAAGVKVSKISALAKDLARSLAVISVRIVEVIPGKSVVGIEIPNEHREIVRLKDILTHDVFTEAKSPLTLALGKDISGQPVVADVARMPHLLVAGTTGSGKSVGVNAMLLSILYKATPEQVRLILVDPKMLELAVYEGIPHLLTPVVTDMKEAAHALNWSVAEMERRYRLMASMGVRNLAGFNRQVRAAREEGNPLKDPLWVREDEPAPELDTLPVIVVVIDEFADMMMIVGKKVEQLIARIAQKARAAGIHLILATQRPSVDVITGLIKANIPSRISFQVSSKVDSRTILDQGGAEQLLGHGDMLYLPPGSGMPNRVHGAFVSDDEVHRLVADWKQRGAPNYLDEILTGGGDEPFVVLDGDAGAEQEDALYDEAVQFVLESRRASISSVQRKLRIGYNRAARLIEAMEEAGLVSGMNTNGSREVLVPKRD